jgi:hypothetical protein
MSVPWPRDIQEKRLFLSLSNPNIPHKKSTKIGDASGLRLVAIILKPSNITAKHEWPTKDFAKIIGGLIPGGSDLCSPKDSGNKGRDGFKIVRRPTLRPAKDPVNRAGTAPSGRKVRDKEYDPVNTSIGRTSILEMKKLVGKKSVRSDIIVR